MNRKHSVSAVVTSRRGAGLTLSYWKKVRCWAPMWRTQTDAIYSQTNTTFFAPLAPVAPLASWVVTYYSVWDLVLFMNLFWVRVFRFTTAVLMFSCVLLWGHYTCCALKKTVEASPSCLLIRSLELFIMRNHWYWSWGLLKLLQWRLPRIRSIQCLRIESCQTKNRTIT